MKPHCQCPLPGQHRWEGRGEGLSLCLSDLSTTAGGVHPSCLVIYVAHSALTQPRLWANGGSRLECEALGPPWGSVVGTGQKLGTV